MANLINDLRPLKKLLKIYFGFKSIPILRVYKEHIGGMNPNSSHIRYRYIISFDVREKR